MDFKTISLEDIHYLPRGEHPHDVDIVDNASVEDLKISIRALGLIQPIAVYFSLDENTYAVIDGKRRLLAFDILNKKYPDEGFDKILCVIHEFNDSNMINAKFLATKTTPKPLERKRLMKIINDLWMQYANTKLVAEKFGISEHIVRKYVKYGRLPDLLKKAIDDGQLGDNHTMAVEIALDAVDLLGWSQGSDISEEKVLELATMLIDHSGECGGGRGFTIKEPKTISVVLNEVLEKKIDELSKDMGMTPKDILRDAIDEFLKRYET